MSTVADLVERLAPVVHLAADWDEVGLQVGDPAAPATALAVCHEVTDAVIDAAAELGVAVLVAYHPLLFAPTTRLVAASSPPGRAWRLAHEGIALVVVHTGWDAALGGTADSLAHAIGVSVTGGFGPLSDLPDPPMAGRVGELPAPMALGDLAAQAAEVLRASGVRVAGPPGLVVQRVAVLPGSGAAFAESAIATGAEVLVTGDVSHHRAVAALDGGLAVVDVGHAPSERPGMEALLGWLREVDLAPVADLTTITTNPWEAP